jgi:hypothetical protein
MLFHRRSCHQEIDGQRPAVDRSINTLTKIPSSAHDNHTKSIATFRRGGRRRSASAGSSTRFYSRGSSSRFQGESGVRRQRESHVSSPRKRTSLSHMTSPLNAHSFLVDIIINCEVCVSISSWVFDTSVVIVYTLDKRLFLWNGRIRTDGFASLVPQLRKIRTTAAVCKSRTIYPHGIHYLVTRSVLCDIDLSGGIREYD